MPRKKTPAGRPAARWRSAAAARRNADARRCGAVFIRRRTAALWRSDDGATPRDCSILSASIFPEPP
ncbi:hypothetical protein [Burkholderia pseudomallei]|uniref:hypothetical protein n=1 Tax=Burkholderia pseudomallei TaxID=28450 RepID=UPI0009761781|nr:hypothetical protein [Burkholderia pseudomallei]